ncbi:MAG: ABC transporter permease [Lachnospiraceae bacterium]|nr:ABC transporter permease [Lachnospiraceae bacterium]
MKYFIKRVIESFVTLFLIITLVFLLMRLLPAEKYFTDDELRVLTADQVQTILEANGLLDPPLEQLVRYYKQLFINHDFGVSRKIKDNVPVMELIGDRFRTSMAFGVAGLCLSLLVGVSYGVVQARYKDRFPDHLGMAYTVLANAVPGLVFYTLIMIFGARVLGLPSLYSPKKPFLSAVMPVVCLSVGGIASRMLWVRRYMVDELNKDYIRLATAKGLTESQILIRHVLRNALVPLCSGLPGAFLVTISGSLLVESFFSIPGMGYLLVEGIALFDYDVVQTLVILYGFLGILGVLLGDITLTLVDPRVRLGKKEATR